MKTVTKDHLRNAVAKVSELIGKFAQAADTDIERVENSLSSHTKSKSNPHVVTAEQVGAAKKPLSGSVTIPTTGWGSDSTADYPKYYDIAVTGVTASDRANVDIATASMSKAVACGLCQTCETLAGKIRVRAVSVPAAAITAQYWVEKGA